MIQQGELVMRLPSLIVVMLAVVLALGAVTPALPQSGDSGSISRDAIGPQPIGTHDPLGGPPTPRVYGLGQPTIFVVGITLLAIAAALGAYTMILTRRSPARP